MGVWATLGAALLAACAPTSGNSSLSSAPSSSRPNVTQSSSAASDAAPVLPSTGNAAYDQGYSFGQGEPPPVNACSEQADDLQGDGTLRSVDEALAFLQGCWDSQGGLSPDAKRAPRLASAADLPEFAGTGKSGSDPCERGDPAPWVVMWGAPGASGEVIVTAPCKAEVKRQARSRIPADAEITGIFRV
jgi:hypothetical protein